MCSIIRIFFYKTIKDEPYLIYYITFVEVVTSTRHCARITSLSDCTQAANYLGLSETEAIDDGQSGVSDDPPYCYFEDGAVKYNSDGLNTGSCTESAKCLCFAGKITLSCNTYYYSNSRLVQL